MKEAEAEALARSLMNQHGLADWHIVWWRTGKIAYEKAGRCVRAVHWIRLSLPIVEANEEGNVREIVLHEIAHALTTGGHSAAWRALAKKIGCSGRTRPRLRMPEGGEGTLGIM